MDKNKLIFDELRPEIETALLQRLDMDGAKNWELVDGFMHYGLTDRVNGKNDYRITVVGLIHMESSELKLYPLFKLLPYLMNKVEEDN